MGDAILNDIILIDKPSGMTSFDVIRRLRAQIGARKVGRRWVPKMGHAGTLDPRASGLMIVGIGDGTKKLGAFLKLPKTYDVEILLGERRSTGDMEGEIVEKMEVENMPPSRVEQVLATMVGILTLPVPLFSAVKQSGVPLYKKARQGKEVGDVPIRNMEVYSFAYGGMRREGGAAIISVTWNVASGVYIRSLAEEFGRRLGYPATTYALRRTKIGDLSVADAQTIRCD